MTQSTPPTPVATPEHARPEDDATPSTMAPATPAAPVAPDLVEADLLVEDVSIDGMCGVY